MRAVKMYFDASLIFIANTYTEPGDPHDITLEDNLFWAPRGGIGEGAFCAINLNSVVRACPNFSFRDDSLAGVRATLPSASVTASPGSATSA